jgi:hypothetical protein
LLVGSLVWPQRVIALAFAIGALGLPAQAWAAHKRLAITQESGTPVEVGRRVFMEGVLAVETYGKSPIGSGSPVYCSGGARSELLSNEETKDRLEFFNAYKRWNGEEGPCEGETPATVVLGGFPWTLTLVAEGRTRLVGSPLSLTIDGCTYSGKTTKGEVHGLVFGRLELEFVAERLKTRMPGCEKYAALWTEGAYQTVQFYDGNGPLYGEVF